MIEEHSKTEICQITIPQILNLSVSKVFEESFIKEQNFN